MLTRCTRTLGECLVQCVELSKVDMTREARVPRNGSVGCLEDASMMSRQFVDGLFTTVGGLFTFDLEVAQAPAPPQPITREFITVHITGNVGYAHCFALCHCR